MLLYRQSASPASEETEQQTDSIGSCCFMGDTMEITFYKLQNENQTYHSQHLNKQWPSLTNQINFH